MGLRHSYTLAAPIYDALLAAATRDARRRSLQALPAEARQVLLLGVGTGLDLPHLPDDRQYTGVDLTPAMLARACAKADRLDFCPVLGDAQTLPFADGSFDAVVAHLILAVVPHPPRCLAEAARVLRPGGTLLVFDKFLRPGQRAPLRRLLTPLAGKLASRLDVEFELLHQAEPRLTLEEDSPALAGGWFRTLRLRRC
jgi:ubiquinone/menaquinone biosynthesis C-methylase UbiE